MEDTSAFTAIGENIHCSRVYRLGGRHVREQSGGGYALVFGEAGREELLPLPEGCLEAAGGRIRHVAAAVRQGLTGNAGERALGRRYLSWLARSQERCGAAWLDLNVDEYAGDPAARREAMAWAAEVVQEASPLPLSIDSADIELLACGLGACAPGRGRPLVNSVSLEREETIALAGESGAAVIAGAGGRERMPADVRERLANTEVLLEMLTAAGLGAERIYLDPLVMPVAVNPEHGNIVLETLGELSARYGEHTRFAPGLSNISYGMPKRGLLNLVFTDLCRRRGCRGGIVDPLQINPRTLAGLDESAESYRLAADFLTGADSFGMRFITAVREGRI